MFRLTWGFRLRQQQLVPIARLPTRRFQSEEAAFRFQRVRFQKARYFTIRRAITWGLYSGAIHASAYYVWKLLDLDIELADENKSEQTHKHGGDKGVKKEDGGPIYAEEDSVFIPMTWAQKMPRTFYKGSDPEWQEFIKVAKDPPRHKRLQHELVGIVYTGTTQHPVTSRHIGKNSKVGRFWLDVQFPDGPPQEYERSGIEIGDGFMAWSNQKVSQENQWRITRALWPKAAFDSLYETGKVLVGIHVRRAKQSLGLEGRDPSSPEERYRHSVEMMQKQQAAQERNNVGSAQTDPGSSPGSVVTSSPTTTKSDSAPARPSQSETSKSPRGIPIPFPPTRSFTSSADLPVAVHVFSTTLNKSWKPKNMEPPRGTFIVLGFVEVRGSRGGMMFDVQSCYDPKTNKFVQVHATVRHTKKPNQSPRGGP